MEFSKDYCTRQEKIKQCLVPTMSEVNAQLGGPLADVFFKTCPESLQGEMALEPLLGPGQLLWISPSDILINKVVLKPPLTIKYMRALTHQALLEIGREIELKYYRVLEEQKRKELEELEELLLFMAERDRERAVNEAMARERELFKLKLMQLNEEFEVLLQQELAKLEAYLKEMYEQLFEERTRNMVEDQEALTLERIEEAVSAAVDLLTKKFLEDLDEQEKSLTEMFELKLQGQKEKYKKLLKNEQEVFQVILKQLKHNLQCNNISNLMYVLCMERNNCLRDKQQIVDEYDARIDDLSKSLEKAKENVEELTKERDEKQRQCEIREKCLLGVICQFQKFINFALKATPTQAEFLLSVKKMMTFELAQAVVQTSPRKHHYKELMPWRTQSRMSEQPQNLVLNDYHNCLNETSPPKVVRESGSEEASLKAFNFNEHLYVREDFRNKISQGFFVRTSSMIWNKDVENLVQLLKTSFQRESASIEESIQKQRSQNSSVRFHSTDRDDQISVSLERQDSANVGVLGAVDSVILQKSIKSRYSDNEDAACGQKKDNGCNILGAKDSLSMVKKVDVFPKSTSYVLRAEDGVELESEIFRTISTATIQLPKPVKKSELADFMNISSATIHLGDGKRQDQSIYTYTGKDMAHPDVTPKTSSDKKRLGMMKSRKSKLISHRNSLEVIKERIYKNKSNIKNLLKVSYEEMTNKSHFVINLPTDRKKLDVNFKHVATLYSDLAKPDHPSKVYGDEVIAAFSSGTISKDDFFTKQNVAEVMGHIGTEHKDTSKDFTVHRLHSIIDILKQDRSLIRIFTNCAQ